jgi:hypothetical protein
MSLHTFDRWSAAFGALLVVSVGALLKRARASPG